MKRIFALTYSYFLLKKNSMPYFRTIMVFTGLLMIHLILIYTIFPIPKSLNPLGTSKIEINNWLPTGITLGVFFLVIKAIFKKEDLERYSFTKSEIKTWLRKMFVYFIILFFTIAALSVLHVRDKW